MTYRILCHQLTSRSIIPGKQTWKSASQAVISLHAELLNLVGGVRRVIDDSGFDFEIVDWNKLVFAGWIDVVPYYTKKETFRLYMDVKSLKDREVSKAQGEEPEPIEAQINNILTGIIKQRERASEMKAQIIHIVSFLYVKPSQRLNAINYFYAEAEKRNVDLRGFRLMDTSMDQIIDFTKLI